MNEFGEAPAGARGVDQRDVARGFGKVRSINRCCAIDGYASDLLLGIGRIAAVRAAQME